VKRFKCHLKGDFKMAPVSRSEALAHDIRNTLSPALLIIENIEANLDIGEIPKLQKLYKAIDRIVELCQTTIDNKDDKKSKQTRKCNIFDILYSATETAINTSPKHVDVKIEVDPITDNGKGMKTDVRDRIERYLDHPDKNYATSRIGVRSTVEALHSIDGRLRLISSDNKGTKFLVIIPNSSIYDDHISLKQNYSEKFQQDLFLRKRQIA